LPGHIAVRSPGDGHGRQADRAVDAKVNGRTLPE
jgi:hypothetical protein